ncbi:hypothetical protein MIMGU_mgv11b023676mg [Erythranthe guttata]|uniref:Uncharacterized protein n=1 Tax=Erythranthe guttata TaxID=4155 RepID=A0A022QQ83_ERYGU|nr:hypothetical protein MIMGU_mgv11b023676mg [Erythranthe guttata]
MGLLNYQWRPTTIHGEEAPAPIILKNPADPDRTSARSSVGQRRWLPPASTKRRLWLLRGSRKPRSPRRRSKTAPPPASTGSNSNTTRARSSRRSKSELKIKKSDYCENIILLIVV